MVLRLRFETPRLIAVLTLLLMVLLPNANIAQAMPTGLFISEYVEGGGNNKAIEIYNGTGAAIDLSDYEIFLSRNGGTSTSVIAMNGALNDGDAYIIAHSSAHTNILAAADDTTGSLNFNGNDAIVLRVAGSGSIVDAFGELGFDPGTHWSGEGINTRDETLRRKATVCTGDMNPSDAFDPSVEWDSFPIDTFGGLGTHSVTCASDTPPSVVSTSPTDGATGVAGDANIEINFNEVVSVVGNWFQVVCGSSGTRNVIDTVVTGGPTVWTINPNTDFSDGETCDVIVSAAQVSDQDDVPDNMATDHTFNFTVVAAVSNWVINEIHADPHVTNGDANGDGVVNTSQDEFVEIVNNTGSAIDISGWTLADSNSTRHTFPGGTIVPDQCAIVVFGGGTSSGTFGGATVQIASNGSLGLNNTGDTITLSDGSTTQATYAYGSEGGDNQSLTRDPDIFGADPLVKHSTATDSGGVLFSPGMKMDGSSFFGCALPHITTTTPSNGALGVAVDTTINIHFSEGVTTTASTFVLECPVGAPIAVSVAPVPPANRFDLTPNVNLPYSTTCRVTVAKDEVIDQDDVPDNMAADYLFTFDTAAAPPPPPATILISEFLYDGLTPSTEGDEFVELCNPNPNPINLTGYKVGDEEVSGGGESMYHLPAISLDARACLVIAKNAAQFQARFGELPDFFGEVGNLTKYAAWSSGGWSLSNTGDELVVLGPNDEILDSVAYRNGDYTTLGLEPDGSAPEPHSLQRVWPTDTDSMPYDFVRTTPNPGQLTQPPPPPTVLSPPAILPDGMKAYWGHLHAHTTYSDGAGPPFYALAMARAAGLHFYAITDHGWWLTESEWTSTLTQTTEATVPDQFVALRGVEWSHDTAGHINVFNTNTLPSRTDPMFDDLSDFYTWLAANPNVIAQFNHPDPSYGGTFGDFAFDPDAAQVIHMQEVGNSAQDYTTYEPSFVQSNAVGWRTAPTNNSDTHDANWGLDTQARTGIVAPALTEADLLDAMRARRVFATEDSNLALTLRANEAWMGSVLTTTGKIPLTIDFIDPDSEPLTLFLYDGNLLLDSKPFAASTGQWTGTVKVLPGHYYWAKVVQADGDMAYSAPIWTEGQAPSDMIYVNELLPAPNDWDWDGNGSADYTDEWIELYNPLKRPVGLGSWRLIDASGTYYDIPLGINIRANGFATFFYTHTHIALNNSGDTVALIHPNGTVIDSRAYDHSPGYDDSWCRLPDAGDYWSDDCGPSPGAANWEKKPHGPLNVNIFEAKRLTRNAWVMVEGQVTAPPGVLGARTMYIQDETSGILVYLPKDHGLFFNLGDEVEVVGNLSTFHEEFEIVVSERSDVSYQKAGPPLHPLPIATTSMLEPYEGMLVLLQGHAVGFKGRTIFWVDDGTDPARVYIRRNTKIKKPFIEPGTPITVAGIVSQYSDKDNPSRADYRLLPRFQTDLILPDTSPVPADWPSMLPETGF